MSSTDTPTRFGRYAETLLETADCSIRTGVERGTSPSLEADAYPEPLRVEAACFVTLQRSGELRGCIGSLEARRPLIEDVAHNAYAAAFRDPRFPALLASELVDLSVHISVLTEPRLLEANNEPELLAKLRPGIDGLILEDQGRRGTFLPAVWDALPEPQAFLRELRLKAGLDPDGWSATLKVWRYEVESIESPGERSGHCG